MLKEFSNRIFQNFHKFSFSCSFIHPRNYHKK